MMKKAAALVLTALFLLAGCAPGNLLQSSGGKTQASDSKEQTVEKDQTSGTKKFAETESDFQREEQSFQNEDGQMIYGEWYVPDKQNGRTIICSHGLGGTGSGMSEYASELAECGYLVYTFDFRGGGFYSQSDGNVSDMSVLTEEEDLEDVYDMVCEDNRVDPESIYLLGMSQGGMVSALYAGDHPDKPAGLLLLYPAFVIPDFASGAYRGDERMQKLFETYSSLGTRYIADAEKMDVEEEIKDYKGPVLLLHGSDDTIVPSVYSVNAAGIYRNAELKIYNGGDHGFSDWGDWQRSVADLREFLLKH